MYNVNTLHRPVLITYEEVIDQSPVSNHADPFQIRQAIQIAEERFIVPLLGRAMYDALCKAKNTLVTEVNMGYLQELVGTKPVLHTGQYVNAVEFLQDVWQVSLWKQHLWKITAEAVYYVANPTVWARHEATGVVLNNPQSALSDGKGSASVDLKQLQWLQDNALMNRIDPLISGMREWIDGNYNYFPLWPRQSTACCDQTESEITRKSAYVNIYSNKDCNYGRNERILR